MSARRVPVLLETDPARIASGLQPDRHPLGSVLWEVGDNAKFYSGKIRRLVPASTVADFGAGVVRGIAQQQTADGVRWIWASSGAVVSRWYGPSVENIHTFADHEVNQSSTEQATFIDFTAYGDWTILNNSINAAQVYKPVGPTKAEYAAGIIPLRFMKMYSFVLAIGWDVQGKSVGASDSVDVEDWDFESTTNTANSLVLEDLETRIRAATYLGKNVAVYAEDQMGLIYFAGAPAWIGRQMGPNGIGAVGKAAVCSDKQLNYGISRNGIWRTDGQDYGYIDEGILHDYLQEGVNWGQGSKCLAFRNDVNRTIEFHFPMGAATEPSEGWAFDPATGGWSKVPGVTFADERRLFRRPLVGFSDGVIKLLEDNTALTAALSLKTKPMLVQRDDGSPLHADTKVDEVELMLKAATAVEFRYGVQDSAAEATTWSEWYACSVGMQLVQLENMPSGTLHRLEFRSTAAVWVLDLQGFALFGLTAGAKKSGGV